MACALEEGAGRGFDDMGIHPCEEDGYIANTFQAEAVDTACSPHSVAVEHGVSFPFQPEPESSLEAVDRQQPHACYRQAQAACPEEALCLAWDSKACHGEDTTTA